MLQSHNSKKTVQDSTGTSPANQPASEPLNRSQSAQVGEGRGLLQNTAGQRVSSGCAVSKTVIHRGSRPPLQLFIIRKTGPLPRKKTNRNTIPTQETLRASAMKRGQEWKTTL